MKKLHTALIRLNVPLIAFYLREIGECPEGLREELVSIIREQKQVE